MIEKNKHTVGIYQGTTPAYSEDWATSENYSEKVSLRALSRLLGCSDGCLLRSIVRPGDRVVIKPNWVLHKHPHGDYVFSVITHSAVLRAVIDLVFEALEGRGEIIIADAPDGGCDFEQLLRVTQVQQISEYYRKRFQFNIPVRDLRQLRCVYESGFIKSDGRIHLPGDPEGYAVVSLGPGSAFEGMPDGDRLYGADYDRKETMKHHNAQRHEYLVSKTILGADVVINIPKLKVHKKVGTTLNAKGMVGINGDKNWVAHFRIGPPSSGGDEFPDSEPSGAKRKKALNHFLADSLLAPQSKRREFLYGLFLRAYRGLKPFWGALGMRPSLVQNGDWYGNDTAWRMVADLARIILYADSTGHIRNNAQRRFYSIVDGIIGGEKEGPLTPTPKPCSLLIAGENILAVDLVAARLMGFSWRKIKYLSWLVENSPEPMGISDPEREIEIVSNIPMWSDLMRDPRIPDMAFQPPSGWKGHIEV